MERQSDTTEAELDRRLAQKREECGINPDLADRTHGNPFLAKYGERWKVPMPHDAEIVETEAELAEKGHQASVASLENQAGAETAVCRLANYRAALPLQKAVLGALLEYSRDLPNRIAAAEGIVLFGPCGTGKDHLAFGVCWEAANRFSMKVRWTNGQDWFGEVRDAIAESVLEEKVVHRMVSPDILAISDVLPPIGALTQHQATMLYRTINARRTAHKPTIVTVNVEDDSEAHKRMGVPTWQRLCDRSKKICCKWSSYRQPSQRIGC